MGRRAKPAALKVAEGTYRADRDGNVDLPKPGRPPNPPTWLGREGKAEWRRLAKDLHTAGLLTDADRAVFTLYCAAWGDWVEASQLIRKDGFVTYTEKGNAIQHPAVSIANKAWQRAIKAGRDFGLTPSARSTMRIQRPEGESPEDQAANEILGM